MQIESLFNGEVRRARKVTTAADIMRESGDIAMGDGWGQQIRGTREELEGLGAHATSLAPGVDSGWVWEGFFCVVE